MDFTKKTVLNFFDDPHVSFSIPVYQRAYSWDEHNWGEFLHDLIEQVSSENPYFFGNVLLESIEQDNHYEIIDGQQRITTITIFVRALINTLAERHDIGQYEFDPKRKASIFLKHKGTKKLRPVSYDIICYDNLIIDNAPDYPSHSDSQILIKGAKQYYIEELSKLDTALLIKIQDKLESSDVAVIKLLGKKEAALMFELENNRGKSLTNMEKLKSFFMYQMYVHSPKDEVDSNIETVSEKFKRIYEVINQINSMHEDSVLIYHNNAYIKGYAYRTLDDLKSVYKDQDDKVNWIYQYVSELLESFHNILSFQREDGVYVGRLRKLKVPAYAYPFILRGYKYKKEDVSQLFQIMEVIAFRAGLVNSRANIQERLNTILLSYHGDNEVLKQKIRDKLQDSDYWRDERVLKQLEGPMYGSKVLNYLLWIYESHLQRKGYTVSGFKINSEQIEHISPQKPKDDSRIASGYETDEYNKYSELFIEKHLNSLGNLVLISGSHNASIGNAPFIAKLSSYKENILLQQTEIEHYAIWENANPQWKSESIIKRQNQIVAFAMKEWIL